MPKQSIVKLRDHPQALEPVTQWIHREWGKFSGRSLRATRERFAQEFTSQGLPTSCVAFDGGTAVGVATLRASDSVDWDTQATPWICNVYVCNEARGMGLASELCRSLEAAAKELGCSQVYLATSQPHDSLYHRLGYVRYRTHEGLGYPMYLMSRKIER